MSPHDAPPGSPDAPDQPTSANDRDRRIRKLLDQVLDVDPGDRRRVLGALEADTVLVDEVLGLLESDD
ncbi:MAG: hypothetical protein AAGM22_18755 [Acidobacteriota bacterium]